VEDLLRHQDGVASRSQVFSLGMNDDDIARLIRRREWARLFEGVYVDHTGPPSWRQSLGRGLSLRERRGSCCAAR